MTLRVWGLWALSAMSVSQLLLGSIRETLVEAAGSAQETARRSQPPAAVRIPKSLSLGREGHNSSLLLILAKVSLAGEHGLTHTSLGAAIGSAQNGDRRAPGSGLADACRDPNCPRVSSSRLAARV